MSSVSGPGTPSSSAPIGSSSPQAKSVPSTSVKCGLCNKRPATKGCSLARCLGCCDSDKCERHKRTREQAKLKEKILEGTTDVQLIAKTMRGKLLKPGRFRETGFVYQGDTVVLWNIREYFANDKWKEDAVRKSSRRNARLMDSLSNGKMPVPPPKINLSRFRRWVARRHREALNTTKKG